jgi:hypothetical protein
MKRSFKVTLLLLVTDKITVTVYSVILLICYRILTIKYYKRGID